jgi:hypothetical protein
MEGKSVYLSIYMLHGDRKFRGVAGEVDTNAVIRNGWSVLVWRLREW